VQLYAAGTSGNGSTPQALLSGAVTTDATGGFTVPSGYTCPSLTATTYLLAEGGQVAGASSANSDLWLMAPIGACGDITASTTAVLNEVTTVASAWALSQFLAPEGNLGATSSNALGLANAVIVANNLVNIATGTSPGAAVPANVTVSTAKLNTLADVLASCVSPAGETACAALFSAATTGGTTPGNTLDAALNIARHPASNVGGIYTLAQANVVFPSLTAAPPDWLLYMTITGGGLAQTPQAIAVDSDGNVWVSTYYGAVAKFAPDGTPAVASGFTGSGINQSYGMALDATDNVWIANQQTSQQSGNGSVTELNDSGQPVLPSPGSTVVGGIYFPSAVATDTNGHVWITDFGDSQVTLLDSTGAAISPAPGFGTGFVSFPVAVAVDVNHNAWIGNTGKTSMITRISFDGSQAINVACCNSTDGLGIATDQQSNVWTADFGDDSVSLITDASTATPDVTRFAGAHSGLSSPNGIAVDGAGNVWVTNYYHNPSGSLTEVAGADASVPGAFLSPPDAGFGSDASMLDPYGIAIDASGNLWVSNTGNLSVTQFVGAAVPVKTPLVGPPQLP
jgi:streptogramin lyase